MSTSNTAGQKMTDAELAKLEKRIAAIYRENIQARSAGFRGKN